jgi:hypothetical protein
MVEVLDEVDIGAEFAGEGLGLEGNSVVRGLPVSQMKSAKQTVRRLRVSEAVPGAALAREAVLSTQPAPHVIH